jgi:hypothetical protein
MYVVAGREGAMEKEVGAHLGQLIRELTSSELDENLVSSAGDFFHSAFTSRKRLSILTRIHTYVPSQDETHFVINMDNGRTLGLSEDKSVRYQDAVSGGQDMTMMVRISGGKGAAVRLPLLVIQNGRRSYPMKGGPGDVPGVPYRTQPKGWVDGKVFLEYLNESIIVKRDRRGRKQVFYVDNCTSHVLTDTVEAALTRLNIEIRKLPPNSTHLTQSCDSFVIPRIKTWWRSDWYKYKAQMMANGLFQMSGSNPSGNFQNPGRHYFLKLAA